MSRYRRSLTIALLLATQVGCAPIRSLWYKPPPEDPFLMSAAEVREEYRRQDEKPDAYDFCLGTIYFFVEALVEGLFSDSDDSCND